MEIVTTETFPPEASMSGKNTVYLSCNQINRRSSYGVCLFTLRSFEKGTLRAESDCYNPVKCGNCPALKYRKQEQEAGRALFFKPREYKEPVDKPMAPQRPGAASTLLKWITVGPKVTDTRPYDSSKNIPLSEYHKPERKAAPLKVAAKKPAAKKSALFGTEVASLADAVSIAAKEDAIKPKAASKPVEVAAKPKVEIHAGMSLLERAKAMRALRG